MTQTVVLSDPVVVDLLIYRGDSGGFRIRVTGPAPTYTPIDVSAATWDADIRAKGANVETITSFDIVPVVGDSAAVDVLLPPEKSVLLAKTGVYDIEMTLSGEVKTLITGKITCKQDVSRPLP